MTEAGKRRNGRRGVALILVLGMLALMLIMATAFSVMMRTEHAGAANFADEIRSKHVVWAALAHAIANIEANIAATDVYPAWSALGPQGRNLADNPATAQVDVVWGKAGDFVPGQLYAVATAAHCNWLTNSGARYSYLVLNCSGLLDGNYAGGSNRTAGVHPGELSLANLSDVESTDALAERRKLDLRYESLQEFNLFQGPRTPGGGISQDFSENFMIGSYFPVGWWSGAQGGSIETNQLYIGGDPAEMTGPEKDEFRGRVITGLNQACSGGGVNAASVYDQLLDYLDDNHRPENLASPCTEAVPMFNEVVVTGMVVNMGGTVTIALQTRVEWVYPFVTASDIACVVDRKIEATVRHRDTGFVYLSAVDPPLVAWGADPIPSDYEPTNILDTDRHIAVGANSTDIVPITFSASNNVPIVVTIDLRLRMLADGEVVDEVPSPQTANPAPALQSIIAFNVPGPGNHVAVLAPSREVIDARYNWQQPAWITPPPAIGGASLGTTNNTTRIYLASSAAGIDKDMSMHVSNAGRLFSVGELGHLLRTPDITTPQGPSFYKTIRLFHLPAGGGAPVDDVFRHFRVREPDADYGLVNLNTEYSHILKTVFENMPRAFPTNAVTISNSDVNKIVDEVMTNGPHVTLSALGQINWRTLLPDWTDVERDALLAYSSGLLGTRNNLFTIILVGGPASQGMGLTGTQEQGWYGMRRAVAVVWRDPFPIEGTSNPARHRYILRYFNWLDD